MSVIAKAKSVFGREIVLARRTGSTGGYTIDTPTDTTKFVFSEEELLKFFKAAIKAIENPVPTVPGWYSVHSKRSIAYRPNVLRLLSNGTAWEMANGNLVDSDSHFFRGDYVFVRLVPEEN
jgi:hypothetical protein